MGVGVRSRRGLTGAPSGKTASSARCEQGMNTTQHRTTPVCRGDGPPADVVAWRTCRLVEAGFAPPLAARLAAGHADVHALLALVDRGCPPELAARILDPDDLLEEGR